ncbi:MAG: hypothetical protein FWE87_03010, partial [Coriobacteriia bacterium]|nr:hypothetical protein [Coriobacteriia bacterium]
MRKIGVVLLIIAVCASLCFSQVASVFAAEQSEGAASELTPTNTVVLILAPYLTWEDIDGATTPRIFELIQRVPVGNLNARSRVKDIDGRPLLLEGALAISSGAWSRVDLSAREAYNVTEMIDGVQSAEIYARLMGQDAGNAAIVYLGLPR